VPARRPCRGGWRPVAGATAEAGEGKAGSGSTMHAAPGPAFSPGQGEAHRGPGHPAGEGRRIGCTMHAPGSAFSPSQGEAHRGTGHRARRGKADRGARCTLLPDRRSRRARARRIAEPDAWPGEGRRTGVHDARCSRTGVLAEPGRGASRNRTPGQARKADRVHDARSRIGVLAEPGRGASRARTLGRGGRAGSGARCTLLPDRRSRRAKARRIAEPDTCTLVLSLRGCRMAGDAGNAVRTRARRPNRRNGTGPACDGSPDRVFLAPGPRRRPASGAWIGVVRCVGFRLP
jgi:hypothetical protein